MGKFPTLTAALVLPVVFGSFASRAEEAALLFQDDFSSGDISRHNAKFRWGRSGAIPSKGANAEKIVTIEGPEGDTVNAMVFSYGTWQEARFHLTKSLDEVRTESGTSDVAYPELWIRYWLRIPQNYSNVAGNDKGWITLWKHSYTNSIVQYRFEWWPAGNGHSFPTFVAKSGGQHIWPSYTAPFQRSPFDGGNNTYALSPDDYGRWVDFTIHVKLLTSENANDAVAEIYKDGRLAIRYAYQKAKYFNIAEGAGFAADGDPEKSGFDRGYILGYHNDGYAERTEFHLTGFQIGTTAASVGLQLDENDEPEAPRLSVE